MRLATCREARMIATVGYFGWDYDSNREVAVVRDEERCRRLLAAMIWPRPAFAPRADARIQLPSPSVMSAGGHVPAFISARTAMPVPIYRDYVNPAAFDRLPLRVSLTGLWLILQSDKGISSVRLAEAIGVSQPTAWRVGHAPRSARGDSW